MNKNIVVVGGGPIGLAFALAASALRDVGITLVERQTLSLAVLPVLFDHRVYALSPGSKALLESLGVWQRIPQVRIEPVRAMQVFGDISKPSANDKDRSEIEFEEGVPLAFIVEYAALMRALMSQVSASENIRVFDNANVHGIDFASGGNTHKLLLGDGSVLDADLLIAADGVASPLRAMAGISTQIKDYESDGVVANFSITRPHGDIARQWLTNEGVLAYLPLPDNQISIVWSVSRALADELSGLDAQAFAAAVARGGDHALGALTLCSERARFPLRRVMATSWVQPGFALIGDAAHAIHPLAGQGANLGFADVRTLCEVLQSRSALSGLGDISVLRKYERARREDAMVMGGITDNLRSLYLSKSPFLMRLRHKGLNVANRMSLAKSLMMAHAMK